MHPLREKAEALGIPVRTLDDVRNTERDCLPDVWPSMRKLMIKHGRLTEEAVKFLLDQERLVEPPA